MNVDRRDDGTGSASDLPGKSPLSADRNQTRLLARDKLTTQFAQVERDSSATSSASPIGGVIINSIQAFGPGDVRTFYDETVGLGHDGTGDCIAIVGISDFLDSTMTGFTNQFGLSSISYTRELHGANPGIDSSGESEAELDLQWAHATEPGASIVYHLGSDLVTEISGAVSDNACGAKRLVELIFALRCSKGSPKRAYFRLSLC